MFSEQLFYTFETQFVDLQYLEWDISVHLVIVIVYDIERVHFVNDIEQWFKPFHADVVTAEVDHLNLRDL